MDIEKKKNFIENFSQYTQITLDKIFQRGLYEITPINRTLNKNFLSLAYTPGVGSVCTQIQKNSELINQLTLRGRSVAVVTQGNCFKDEKIQPGKMMPIVDWCISQIKFYSNVDCFPFIIRQNANLMNVMKDIANAYAAILILDIGVVFNTQQLPDDVVLIKQQEICNINGKPCIDCEDTAKILAYVLTNKIRGIIGQNILKEGIKFKPNPFKKQSAYFILYRDEKSIQEKAFDFHKKFSGKIQIELNFGNIQQLKKYFTPQNLLDYVKNKIKKRGFQQISAIVTNATAILGLGDIGPKAGLPVMEGKSLLFKTLGGSNVIPICINKRKTYQQTIEAILDIASFFRALNLEDIKSPDCFYIEKSLKQKKILPIFHDDQHGTAIVTLAALINALKVAQKMIDHIKVILCGVGAAGIAICKLLLKHGVKNIIMSDTKGAIYNGREQNMNQQKQKLAQITNPNKLKGSLADIIKGADVFIGVSRPGTMKTQWVQLMNERPIVFAMANPDPQITLDDALKGGAFIYGSGRSDFKNQINNSLVFPGIFRAIHQHNLQQITEQMEQFVAVLIANHIDKKPTQRHIIVDSLDLDIPVLISNGLGKFKTKVESAKF